MYTPRAFAVNDLVELDRLVARDAFVTMISSHEGAPFASHLPMLYARDGQKVQFRGHWARPNPQWRGIEDQQVMLVVHGPHAYISPSWYADPAVRVPTWNYAVAHVYGRMRVFEDLDSLAALVAELAAKYESSVGSNWRFDPVAQQQRDDLRGIVGFEFDAERVELKLKLNQNHPEANVRGAAESLERLGGEQGLAVAALMRERLAQRQGPQESRDGS